MSQVESVPVFLTGYPKSGTTLILSLLDGHPQLNVFPKETLFFQYAEAEIRRDRDRGLERFVERIFGAELFGLEDVLEDPVDSTDYLAELTRLWKSEGYRESAFLFAAVEAYGRLIGTGGRRCWVEKTPHTELHVRRLVRWYPNARVIHCNRDPRANFAAIAAWHRREGWPLDLVRFCTLLSNSWSASARNRSILPQLDLRYEDVVDDAEREMKRVCEFLQIDFDERLLVPTLAGRPFGGNSMHEARMKGVSRSSRDRWRSSLSEIEVMDLEWLMRREMRSGGYESVSKRVPSLARRMRYRVEAIGYRIYDRLPPALLSWIRGLRGVHNADRI